ncbi:uncharacterized protein [Leptinotarsa decemlineata]|uniref:uncharacterized protein n=1 Tax=Leptinotarsa decemlineata TaxID=7539 RepID=UPI003D30498A
MRAMRVIFLKMCNFFAVAPWYNSQTEVFIRPIVYKYYSFGMLLFLFLTLIICEIFVSFYPLTMFFTIVLGLDIFCNFFLVAISVYYSTTKIKDWKCLSVTRRYLNISLHFYGDSPSNWVFWMFYILLSGFVLYHCTQVYLDINNFPILLVMTPRLMYNHEYMMSVVVSSSIACSLKSTNDMLMNMLTTEELFSNERKFIDYLKEMVILYQAIRKKVNSFNSVFGNFLLVAMGHQLLFTLTLVKYLIQVLYTEFDVSGLVFLLQILVIQNFGFLYAIICCDETMREGRRLLTTCFLRKGKTISGRCREELVLFTEYLKDYPVVLSAGNFFELTRNNLLNHLGVVATYLIIFTQLSNFHV